jgi:ParB/RepB/Spo0J family partition protein
MTIPGAGAAGENMSFVKRGERRMSQGSEDQLMTTELTGASLAVETPLMVRVSQATYCKIPVEEIVANPEQPRRFFDQEALRALADSIKQIGLLEDILVTPRDSKYMLVLGERRWKATQLAALPTISAKVVELSDAEVRRISLTENIQRENLTAVEEAFAFKHYVDNGLRQKEVGEVFGRMQDRVADRLKTLSSHYYVQFQEDRIKDLENKLKEAEQKKRLERYDSSIVTDEEIQGYIERGYEIVHCFKDGRLLVRRLSE